MCLISTVSAENVQEENSFQTMTPSIQTLVVALNSLGATNDEKIFI